MTEFEKAWGPMLKQADGVMTTSVSLHLDMAFARIVKGPTFLPQQRSHFGAWYTFILEVQGTVKGAFTERFPVTVEYTQEFMAGEQSPQERAQAWSPPDTPWKVLQREMAQGDPRTGFIRVLKHPLPKWLGADSSARWNVVG